MNTTNFHYVKNLVYKLSPRDQRRIWNSLSYRFGDSHSRAGAGYTSDDGDGDYRSDMAQKELEKQSYQHKIELIKQIVNKNEIDAEHFDLFARPKELHELVDILTYGQIGRLNFYGLCRMLRIAAQSRSATNSTAYILTGYKNLVNGVDYKNRWAAEREAERNRNFVESLVETESDDDKF